jgi:H+/Cl- antiporter ClcA
MNSRNDWREHATTLTRVVRECALVAPVGILAGSASALFLWSLDRVTATREAHGWLLFLLPVAGLLMGLIYHRWGRATEAGNNLIIEQIHAPGGGVPRRMAPFILGATLLTHLCGGSAGREGTAVQMGGSLASAYARLLRIDRRHLRLLLIAGVAGGFGSVFGTPIAGAVFALEVLVVGRIHHDALLPALVASVIGDLTCSAWGIHHAVYHVATTTPPILSTAGLQLAALIALAAVAFGGASRLFWTLTHELTRITERLVPIPWLRPALGGVVIIALTFVVGTRDYLGLGVSSSDPSAVTLLSAFHPGGATPWSWGWKLLFTAVTLAVGFKGGEVTPLFIIGATLGHAIAVAVGAPVDLFAALGFVAVFAGATKTPLGCTMLGIELFGAEHAVALALACFIAYLASGRGGIYSAQRPASATP